MKEEDKVFFVEWFGGLEFAHGILFIMGSVNLILTSILLFAYY